MNDRTATPKDDGPDDFAPIIIPFPDPVKPRPLVCSRCGRVGGIDTVGPKLTDDGEAPNVYGVTLRCRVACLS